MTSASVSPTHPTTQSSTEPARHSIGHVLAELREEFPELTSSKIRFLEEQGLVTPHRTASGYRKFSAADTDRIRLVLVLQRDHHLPLSTIREHLATLDDGGPAPMLGLKPRLVPSSTDAATNTGAKPTRVRLREFLVLTGATHELVQELQQFDVIQPSSSGFFSQRDLDITSIAAQMQQFGIEPRHLRAFKSAADRELDLIDQVVAPIRRRRTTDGVDAADDVYDSLLGLSVRLHAALLGIGSPTRER